MKKVLVTGSEGQLGKCLKDASSSYPKLSFYFASKSQLDITNLVFLKAFFVEHTFDYCINTAAYTNVEKAEKEKEKAFLINAEGVKNIAEVCREHNTVLIHISTDYVFDGKKKTPYVETDITKPINIYGASKLKGEKYVQERCKEYFIIRTSWLYSQFGHNFLNTILKFAKEKKELTITTEQTGTPTNANDLAGVLIEIIDSGSKQYGLYHYSNEGEATWYDFAKAIIEYSGFSKNVNVVETDYYPIFAARPSYSVLSKEKYLNTYKGQILDWQESLEKLLNHIHNN